MKYEHQCELVEGLRELADFIEDHPELPITQPYLTLTFWIWSEGEEGKRKAAIAARAFGNAQKIHGGGYLDIRKKFGPIAVDFTVSRDAVCRRIVTGTKVTPAETRVIPERVEETVEWICDEPLLA